MRVLLVSPYDLTYSGGVTTHVMELARSLDVLGHDVMIAGPTGKGDLAPSINTLSLGETVRVPSPGDSARINLNPLAYHRVGELLKSRRFDVVHLHEPYLPFIGPAFLGAAECARIATFHATRVGPHLPYSIGRHLLRSWNHQLDARIAVSESARLTIDRYVHADYAIIPNGVDVGRFMAPAPPPPHLADKVPTVLYVGRIEARKGIPFLLEAFGLVQKSMPSSRLVLVGQGQMTAQYEAIAARLGLENVSFEGHVPADELPGYFQRADVFCSPSTVNESFGITLLEAMAAGTPTIATSITASTLGESGVTGLSVPPGDAAALAQSLLLLLEDRRLAERIAAAARQRAWTFDWSTVGAQVAACYEESMRLGPNRAKQPPVFGLAQTGG